MTCQHTGHDHDCDLTPECPGCGEITPSPDQHICHDMAWDRFKPGPIEWIDSWQLIGNPTEAYIPLRPHDQEKP